MLLFAMNDERLRTDIEQVLGLRFEEHDSSYLGNYWVAELPDGTSSLRIRWNRDPLWQPGDSEAERFAYPEFAEHSIVLELHGESPDAAERLGHMPALRFLGDRH